MYSHQLYVYYIPGWWLTYPSEEYEFVRWDYEIPNLWKVIKFHGSKPPTRKYVHARWYPPDTSWRSPRSPTELCGAHPRQCFWSTWLQMILHKWCMTEGSYCRLWATQNLVTAEIYTPNRKWLYWSILQPRYNPSTGSTMPDMIIWRFPKIGVPLNHQF